MVEQRSIVEKVDAILEHIEKEKEEQKVKKNKRFRLPFKVRGSAKNAAKQGKALILLLKTNRNIEPVIANVEDNSVRIGGTYYDASTWFFYLWDGKIPTMVIPEWSLQPIGTRDYEQAVENGIANATDAENVILKALEKEEAGGSKKKIGGKAVAWILIGAIVIGYLLFKGGG